MKNLPGWALWVLTIFLTLIFVLTGLSKLAGPSSALWAARFSHWGYPAFARIVVGCLEILGGLGLVLNSSRRNASIGLMVILAGALCTHLVHGEFVRLISPIFLGALAFVLYSQNRSQLARRL